MAEIKTQDILNAAQRAGCAHNNGVTGEFILCATEAQLSAFAESLRTTSQPVGVPEDLPLAVTSAPAEIWLDLGFDPNEEDAHFSNLVDVTWSEDNPTDFGIKYVRADLTASPTPPAAQGDPQVGTADERAAFDSWKQLMFSGVTAWDAWQARAALSAAPTAAGDEARPMTDEQIDAIASDNSLDTIHAVARAIERHHGIAAQSAEAGKVGG